MPFRTIITELRESVDLAKGTPKENPLGSLNLDDKIHALVKIIRKRIHLNRADRSGKDDVPFSTQPGAPPVVA